MTLANSDDDLGASNSRNQARASAAATIGSIIEWYDFAIYGTMATIAFPQLFFPSSSADSGLVQSFTTIFVGFLARPVGAAVFGHIGDRLGRKSTLLVTLGLMGLTTIAIGCLPTYAAIGAAAPALLLALRFLQGIGVGGEWAGSVLMSMEWHGGNRRGLFASLAHVGVPVGLVLAIGAANLARAITGDRFMIVGWRLPFLASVVLVLVGLFLRLKVNEPPEFARRRRERSLAARPLIEAIRTQWPNIILAACSRFAEQSFSYVIQTFVIFYCAKVLGLGETIALNAILASAVVSIVTVPLFGWLSDRYGRKRTYITGAICLAVYAVPYFWLLDTKIPAVIVLAVVVSMVIRDIMFGPEAAMLTEIFPVEVRYSAASLGYHGAAIIAGGPAPLVSLWLFHRFGTGYAVSAYLIFGAVISVIATSLLGRKPTVHTQSTDLPQPLVKERAN